jgi:hypothetical protein
MMTPKPGAVFNFAKNWGKLGDWRGSLSPHEAKMIMGECAKLPRGSTLVDLGFDGGRTTIVLGWIAQMSNSHVLALGPEIRQLNTEVWFQKAVALFSLRQIVKREFECAPFPIEVIVVSPMVIEVAEDWIAAIKPGGLLIYVRPRTEPDVPGFEMFAAKDGVFILKRGVVQVIDEGDAGTLDPATEEAVLVDEDGYEAESKE